MNDVTRLIERIESGDGQASEELLPLVYSELRSLAAIKLASEKPGQTLQATALVHEAYLRLVDQDQTQNWENRRHFFSAAAEAMRRILIERARQNRAAKCGGDLQRVEFESNLFSGPESDSKLIALNEALEQLRQTDPQKAELVKLRFFGGLTIQQAARALNISTATADRHWAFARAWLQNEISGGA